tara:strand:+ start:714 stop:1307 length:594 start_codon:yes stop_codon:yes gene_type:complete
MNIQNTTRKCIILSFIILLSNNSYSKDVYDIDIYGYKLSKSLFDYFSAQEIKGMIKQTELATQNKFDRYQYDGKTKDGAYDAFTFQVRKGDPTLILYGISAVKFFGKNNIELCESKRKKITNEIIRKYPKVKPTTGTYRYKYLNDGKSIAYITQFLIQGGAMRTYCIDWSEQDEKKENYEDNLRMDLQSEIFLKYKK